MSSQQRTVRHGVFETNSSSTHAISIASSTYLDQQIPLEYDGSISIRFGAYGRRPEAPNHCSEDKLSYAATYAKNYGAPYSECMLEKVVTEHLGATKINYVLWNECHPHGYIDHQSAPDVRDIFKDEDTLRRFLFSSDSYFELDHD